MPKKRRATGLPTINQLPSGAWHARVYTHTDDSGKACYESITDYDYNQVLLRAAQLKAEKLQERSVRPEDRLTLQEAMESYIESKNAVLSPSTIRSYRTIVRNYLRELRSMPVKDITREQVQVAINQEALSLSPKTVRNIHGFLVAVMQVHRPDFVLHTTLPQKKKPSIVIPTEEDIKRLFSLTRDTELEIPVILAACCGMRRSEIAALTWDRVDFTAGTITIDQALVLDDEREFVQKTTKTVAGTRVIRMIPYVATALAKKKEACADLGGYITIRPDLISNRFYNLIRKNKFPEYRFHDLRHYTVSVMLSLNVPLKYISSYVGHETTELTESIYAHIMASKRTSVEDQLEEYFRAVLG